MNTQLHDSRVHVTSLHIFIEIDVTCTMYLIIPTTLVCTLFVLSSQQVFLCLFLFFVVFGANPVLGLATPTDHDLVCTLHSCVILFFSAQYRS